MSDTTPRPIRGESLERLRQLEGSTARLAGQVEGLIRAIGELAEIRQQAVQTTTQAELAVLTSLDATNEISSIGPTVRDLARQAVTHEDVRRGILGFTIYSLVAVLVLSYVVVTGNQIFSKECQLPGYLSEQQASICNAIFIGDRHFNPGVQYTQKISPSEG